jgi:coenzyme F420-0:L-glutamate ligase / coenzyme F420-1:gamma-L-glutamate ligase
MSTQAVAFHPVAGLPEFDRRSNLAAEILLALRAADRALMSGDVLVVAQKIVSKCEGRWVSLASVEPAPEAIEIARRTGKDPRFVETVLRESREVVRVARNVLITRHRSGFVMANAGIDRSNVGPASDPDRVLLLPEDPDRSARQLRDALRIATGADVGVIVSDSFGRPWRYGVVNVALGVAGPPPLRDLRGTTDRAGRVMETTEVAWADAVAAGAALAMGEGAEGVPVVRVTGLDWTPSDASGQTLIRAIDEDLFR